MRTRYNGFVKFMAKLDGKPVTKQKRTFTYKEDWPGECSPELFVELTRNIVQNYSVGDILSEHDQVSVDLGIVWDSVCIGDELADIHSNGPIPHSVMECFENWNWRIENGGEPSETNYEEETTASF